VTAAFGCILMAVPAVLIGAIGASTGITFYSTNITEITGEKSFSIRPNIDQKVCHVNQTSLHSEVVQSNPVGNGVSVLSGLNLEKM